MAILIDPPRWPAHGTIWGHVVSDTSLPELHAFAQRAGLPLRGFDHDHYDVPQHRYADLVALGAEPVSSAELVRRLVASGLRIRPGERTPSRAAATTELERRWRILLPERPDMGAELLTRWSAPTRHYHDVRHLIQCLNALDVLTRGRPPMPVVLAAWFHDAVYDGVPGDDERASADLAEAMLADAVGRAQAAEVARLVRLTEHHAPSPDDEAGCLLSDADLSILAASAGRYHVYLRDVRLDYAHVSDADFAAGRRRVVESLLATDPLFRTHRGHDLWEAAARANLEAELSTVG